MDCKYRSPDWDLTWILLSLIFMALDLAALIVILILFLKPI